MSTARSIQDLLHTTQVTPADINAAFPENDQASKIYRSTLKTLLTCLDDQYFTQALSDLSSNKIELQLKSGVPYGFIKKDRHTTTTVFGKCQANYLCFFLVMGKQLEKELGEEGLHAGNFVATAMHRFFAHRDTEITPKLRKPFDILYKNLTSEGVDIFSNASVFEIGSDANTIAQLGNLTNIFGSFLYDTHTHEDLEYSSESFIKLSNWKGFTEDGGYDFVITANVISPYAIFPPSGREFEECFGKPERERDFFTANAETMAALANLTRHGGSNIHVITYDKMHSPCLMEADAHNIAGLNKKPSKLACTGQAAIYDFERTNKAPVSQDEFLEWEANRTTCLKLIAPGKGSLKKG